MIEHEDGRDQRRSAERFEQRIVRDHDREPAVLVRVALESLGISAVVVIFVRVVAHAHHAEVGVQLANGVERRDLGGAVLAPGGEDDDDGGACWARADGSAGQITSSLDEREGTGSRRRDPFLRTRRTGDEQE